MQFATIFYALAMLFVCAFAAPLEARQETVSNVVCTSKTWVLQPSCRPSSHVCICSRTFSFLSALDFHTSNVALLQICGGIAGTIQKCQGSPTSTVGQSGNVRFTIKPVVAGDTINISKGRWERE